MQSEASIKAIKQLIEKAEALIVSDDLDHSCFQNWQYLATQLLKKIFGDYSDEMQHVLGAGQVYLEATYSDPNVPVIRNYSEERGALERMKLRLEGLIAQLEMSSVLGLPISVPTPAASEHRKVFVVHGHNEAIKQSVCRLLERLALQPVVLHEQPDQGRTIIEKFIDHADVAFAVVLLTADDLGRCKVDTELKARARQNVILELGYFVGRLGRARVCALYEAGVEIPSDFAGVLYKRLDDREAWKLELALEIAAADIKIDLNLLKSG